MIHMPCHATTVAFEWRRIPAGRVETVPGYSVLAEPCRQGAASLSMPTLLT